MPLYVIDHTDVSGSASYNLRLRKQRAKAVKTYFLKKSVASSHLNVIGKGESDLKYPKRDDKNYKSRDCLLKMQKTEGLSSFLKQ
ncbi:OmpA family protein [Bacteroidetes bacterium endosymbiont of Geopemphigus sp.]|uniref:OmpA family protein n=1 Tax=Bacteroidetes bacterium endosymbiont of Geopemphigus sp. TaxID=2047937 RepID=UPI000CD0EADC|nr:OmpA family protein [Bacteroidetes bacterium endosymbiont of Geopemphigus sp.]